MQKLAHLAYNKLEGKSPTAVFLHGFRSDMEGTKALYLEDICKEIGQSFIRFDCSGHGKSGGDFKDGTIGQWKNDALKIIDELTDGPVILVGSSMGGWLALLVALERKEKIKAIIGIAAAPDFTEDLMWKALNPKQQKQVIEEGVTLIPNCYDDQEPYPITKNLIEEGRNHLLLQKSINLSCPVRLIQGMKDEDVPYQTANRIAEELVSDDVEISFVEDGDHRMSSPENLELLKYTLLDIINS